ncbi:hypothetical protein PG987_000908 [Apiospora arundinis]
MGYKLELQDPDRHQCSIDKVGLSAHWFTWFVGNTGKKLAGQLALSIVDVISHGQVDYTRTYHYLRALITTLGGHLPVQIRLHWGRTGIQAYGNPEFHLLVGKRLYNYSLRKDYATSLRV